MQKVAQYLLSVVIVLVLCSLGFWLPSLLDHYPIVRNSLFGLALAQFALRLIRRSQSKERRHLLLEEPPLNATFLFYLLLDARNCDAIVGDLEERYRRIRKKFGIGRATFWYWVQTVTSVSPIVWAATKQLLKTASGMAALVEIWRRIVG